MSAVCLYPEEHMQWFLDWPLQCIEDFEVHSLSCTGTLASEKDEFQRGPQRLCWYMYNATTIPRPTVSTTADGNGIAWLRNTTANSLSLSAKARDVEIAETRQMKVVQVDRHLSVRHDRRYIRTSRHPCHSNIR